MEGGAGRDLRRRQRAVENQPDPFTLVQRSIFRGGTGRLLRTDDRAELCLGAGSASCKENEAARCKCENGVCWNQRVQRRAFRRTQVREAHGQWGLFMEEDGMEGDMVEE